jgi:hypothetical protein
MIRTCGDCGNSDCQKWHLNGRPDDEDCWEPPGEVERGPVQVPDPLQTALTIAQLLETVARHEVVIGRVERMLAAAGEGQ